MLASCLTHQIHIKDSSNLSISVFSSTALNYFERSFEDIDYWGITRWWSTDIILSSNSCQVFIICYFLQQGWSPSIQNAFSTAKRCYTITIRFMTFESSLFLNQCSVRHTTSFLRAFNMILCNRFRFLSTKCFDSTVARSFLGEQVIITSYTEIKQRLVNFSFWHTWLL